MAAGKIDNATIVVKGYKEFLKAAKNAGTATNREVRAAFRRSGEIVRADAAQHIGARYSTRSAAGLKVRVRQRGIAVEQSLKKTTGQHPQYGSLQMRVLLGALYGNEAKVEAEFEHALDEVKRVFER